MNSDLELDFKPWISNEVLGSGQDIELLSDEIG